MSTRQNGTIYTYRMDRGYGFIVGDDRSNWFFHIRNIIEGKLPKVGDKVSFEEGEDSKGRKLAVTVVIETEVA